MTFEKVCVRFGSKARLKIDGLCFDGRKRRAVTESGRERIPNLCSCFLLVLRKGCKKFQRLKQNAET